VNRSPGGHDHADTPVDEALGASGSSADAGQTVPRDLAGATARLQELVPYLRAVVGADRDGEWWSCADLMARPDRLVALATRTGAERGTDDAVVAVSLFAQAYAFRLAGTAFALWLVSDLSPTLEPASTSFTLARSRPASVAWHDTSAAVDPAGARLRHEIVGHLAAFVAAVRGEVEIGERLLWGNTVTAMAVAARAVHGAFPAGERLPVRDRAQGWLDALPADARGLGTFVHLGAPEQHGWFWERTNCCLNDRIPGAPRCGDCSRTPPHERRAAFLASLAAP
jgi:ferric iron reductase protein FhuF